MQRLIIGFSLAVILSLIPAFTAVAARDEVFLAKMRVVRETGKGSSFEYEVETEGRGRAVLKSAPYRFKVGEAVNLFVAEGAKESGKPAYKALKGWSARSFQEGLAAVMVKENPNDLGEKWGFIDKKGKLVIEPKYDHANSFSGGLAVVIAANKWGFIDKSGKAVVKMTYDEARAFSEGIAAVRRGHAWGCIDKNGQVAVEFIFSEIKPFVNGLAPARNDNADKGKWGYIDKKGNFVIKPQYDSAQPFSEGLAVVSEKTTDERVRKWKYIDAKGQTALWFYL